MIYAQRLIDALALGSHELHLVVSNYAQAVIAQEIPGGLRLPANTPVHGLKSMNVPFASGSNAFEAMVIVPCTMGTMGRIAQGISDDVLLRTADVMLKERRKLILLPRETPFSLIHIKNMELLCWRAQHPARESAFYMNPTTIEEVVDTVVARILDHGNSNTQSPRWKAEFGEASIYS
jgi:4-hydroxy-3-polyprenylbenzoate decarboxylase